jgi:hypothetical protein
VVSEFNNILFNEAVNVFEDSVKKHTGGELNGGWHFGLKQLGDFIDHLEKNYEIKKK